jgi:uncharacterized membrane protein YvlD (DUF360 family)
VSAETLSYGEALTRDAALPRLEPWRLLGSLLVTAVALMLAAAILPGLELGGFGSAFLVALVLGAVNGVLPPLLAALALPYTVATTFLLVLATDALALLVADAITRSAIVVDGFGWALVAAVLVAAFATVADVVLGTNDDEIYSLRVVHRVARSAHDRVETERPGLLILEIDGLAYPVLQRAMRDGNAPSLARFLRDGTHRLVEWETDLSSQTGAMQAGILLGSNDDIPAFRWVEKGRGVLMSCSNPDDCAELERRLGGDGLLRDGGASRGNLLSGEADHALLTASRVAEEKRANPGYRAFFASSDNVTRTLVLSIWEIVLELVAAARQRRRDVRPRGDRGGSYPLARAALCVLVRDLVAYAVLKDMFEGRPAVFATFASYDKVAHNSGLERPDTLEALRKLDQRIGQIDRARRYAPRPYHLVVLSDHGQTQGETFLQRNAYSLADLVQRSIEAGAVQAVTGGDEQETTFGVACDEATGHGGESGRRRGTAKLGGKEVVVLGSGNLGLVYLLEQPRRLMLEEIEEGHPRLVPALLGHPHVGFVMARSQESGTVVLGPRGRRCLSDGLLEDEDPLAPFPANAASHLLRSDRFSNAPDLWVHSFYDAELDDACAFEELISFHGGLGGNQTRPFILAPRALPFPADRLVGAAAVHGVLKDWRVSLQGVDAS